MGLFDTIIVNVDSLPDITETQRELIKVNGPFQSKSLNCMMGVYHIADDGRLLMETGKWEIAPDSEQPPTSDNIRKLYDRVFRLQYRETEDVEYHGILNFYTYVGRTELAEFNAKFTDGKLVWIKRFFEENEKMA